MSKLINMTTDAIPSTRPPKKIAGVKEVDAAKTSRIPIKIIPTPHYVSLNGFG